MTVYFFLLKTFEFTDSFQPCSSKLQTSPEKSYKECLTLVKFLLEDRESGKPLVRKDGDAVVIDIVPSCQAEISLATLILLDCSC